VTEPHVETKQKKMQGFLKVCCAQKTYHACTRNSEIYARRPVFATIPFLHLPSALLRVVINATI